MIVGVYATLGVFLIIASRNPLENLLIWITAWSSLVHAGSWRFNHLSSLRIAGIFVGDVPALLVVAIVLAGLTPRGGRARPTQFKKAG